eukprot:jgi/Astpho2/7448/Aster-02027
MAPRKLLNSVENKINLANGLNKSSIRFTVNDKLKVTLEQRVPQSATAVKLEAANWELFCDYPRRDVAVMFKRQIRNAMVTFSQAIPEGKLFLLPTPALKVEQGVVSEDGFGKLKAEYSCLSRRGQFSHTLYMGEDKERKVSLVVDSLLGPTLLARLKLRQGMVHSLKGSWSEAVGPLAELKSRPLEGTKLKVQARAVPRQITAIATWLSPELGDAKRRVQLSAEAASGLPGSAKSRQQLVCGLKVLM